MTQLGLFDEPIAYIKSVIDQAQAALWSVADSPDRYTTQTQSDRLFVKDLGGLFTIRDRSRHANDRLQVRSGFWFSKEAAEKSLGEIARGMREGSG